MKMKNYPKRGEVYTYAEIIKLELRDTPCLRFISGDSYSAVQDSHVTEEELLTVPQWAESKWKYQYETSEWIPVFHYVGDIELSELLDIEPLINPYEREADGGDVMWATPKGFPRPQHYEIVEGSEGEESFIQMRVCESRERSGMWEEMTWPLPDRLRK